MNNDLKDATNNNIQVYFTEESGLYNIDVKADNVDEMMIKGDFLIIHDICDNVCHCYNMKYVKHFHFPIGIKL